MRWKRPRLGALLAALTAMGALLLLALPHQLQDLDVYRAGGHALLHGRSPYTVVSGPAKLPFTYPPFAGILALPLGAVPRSLGALLLFAGDALALWVVHRWLRPRLSACRRGTDTASRCWSALEQPLVFGGGALLLLEPVRSSAAYGQINLLLLGLVVGDLGLRRAGRATGVLTGAAAAVKLTPLIFLAWLMVSGQRRAAVLGAASFALSALLAYALAPAASVAYWRHYVRDSTRIGSAVYGSNQALTGVIARTEDVAAPRGPVTVALIVTTLVLGLGISAAWVRRDRDLSLCLAALTGLIASPISWSHHWVWFAPAGMLLLSRPERSLRAGGGAVLGVALLALPSWWQRGGTRELHRGWSDYVFGETYLWAAVLVLTVAGCLVLSTATRWSSRPRT